MTLLFNLIFLLQQTFHIPATLAIVFILLGFLSLLGLSVMTGKLILDSIYRPHSPQYPFNKVIDYIFPGILLTLPTFLIFALNLTDAKEWIQKLIFLILLHCFLIIPLFYIWSKYRNWSSIKENDHPEVAVPINHPLFLSHIAMGMVYIMVWCLYIVTIRYFRLSQTLDFSPYFPEYHLNNLILITVILSMVIINYHFYFRKSKLWYYLGIIGSLRRTSWNALTSVIRGLHLYFLRFNLYFIILRILHKLAYVLLTYIALLGFDFTFKPNDQYPLYRRILRYLFFYPFIFRLFILGFFILELLLTKGHIFYSLYLLFYSVFINFLGHLLFTLLRLDLAEDVSIADYIARNWKNPRFPLNFWVNFDNPEVRGFSWDFSTKEIEEIRLLAAPYCQKRFPFVPMLPYRISQRGGNLCMRIRAGYRSMHGIRWVHTAVQTIAYHKATAYLTKTASERVVLLRSDWGHYSVIARAEKRGLLPNDPIYNNSSFPRENIRFKLMVEQNFLTNYLPLKKLGVGVDLYRGQKMDTSDQAEPDSIIDMSKGPFIDKRVHGIDAKSGKSHVASVAFTGMDAKTYENQLRKFQGVILYEFPNVNKEAVISGLSQLKTVCNDPDALQITWATNLHHFPMIPPLRFTSHFSSRDTTSAFEESVQRAECIVYQKSAFCHKLDAKNPGKNLIPEDYLIAFEGSEIQEILKTTPLWQSSVLDNIDPTIFKE